MPFLAYEAALAAIHCLRGTLPRIGDADLASQLRRAADSCALNLAEGARRRGRDRTHHFRIAAGSAAEAKAALDVAVAWGHVAQADVNGAWAALDRVLQLTWPMVKSPAGRPAGLPAGEPARSSRPIRPRAHEAASASAAAATASATVSEAASATEAEAVAVTATATASARQPRTAENLSTLAPAAQARSMPVYVHCAGCRRAFDACRSPSCPACGRALAGPEPRRSTPAPVVAASPIPAPPIPAPPVAAEIIEPEVVDAPPAALTRTAWTPAPVADQAEPPVTWAALAVAVATALGRAVAARLPALPPPRGLAHRILTALR